jgi:hypothetical protein
MVRDVGEFSKCLREKIQGITHCRAEWFSGHISGFFWKLVTLIFLGKGFLG